MPITINRETYSDLLRLVRSTLYLWTPDLIEAGSSGERWLDLWESRSPEPMAMLLPTRLFNGVSSWA